MVPPLIVFAPHENLDKRGREASQIPIAACDSYQLLIRTNYIHDREVSTRGTVSPCADGVSYRGCEVALGMGFAGRYYGLSDRQNRTETAKSITLMAPSPLTFSRFYRGTSLA